MNPVFISSYRSAELPLLLEQYKNSPKFIDFIGAALDQADDLEVALFEVRDYFYLTPTALPAAVGVQLDIIGKVFWTPRIPGESDIDYRARIQKRALARLSGTPDDIMFACTTFLGASFAEYTPLYPAAFSIRTDIVIPRAILEELAPSGVGVGIGQWLEYLDGSGNLQPLETEDGSYIYTIT